MRVLCHIGLHKTATTFLQGNVFPAWQMPGFFYNPAPISGLIRSVFLLAKERERYPEFFSSYKRQLLDALASFERTHPHATVLLSYEKFSQFDFHQNYNENALLLRELLPGAQILLFLRYQPDWLFSLFKQAIASGDYQDPFTLFGYRKGSFGSFEGPWGEDGLLKIDALRADWGTLIRAYRSLFGEHRLRVCFYEDFVADPERMCREIADLLDLNNSLEVEQTRVNVGISLGLCQNLHQQARRLRELGLSWLLHSSQKEYRRLLQRLCYKDSRLAYLLHTRPKLLTRSLDWMLRLASSATDDERFKAQLATMRPQLDAHYRALNGELSDLLPGQRVPANYLADDQ